MAKSLGEQTRGPAQEHQEAGQRARRVLRGGRQFLPRADTPPGARGQSRGLKALSSSYPSTSCPWPGGWPASWDTGSRPIGLRGRAGRRRCPEEHAHILLIEKPGHANQDGACAWERSGGQSAEGQEHGHHSRDAGLQSPILESSTSKGEVRLLAKELGLPNWERPVRDDEMALSRKRPGCARKYLVSLGFKDACSQGAAARR